MIKLKKFFLKGENYMAEKYQLKKKIYALLLAVLVMLSNFPIISYAKASVTSEQNFANVVLFAHFRGDNASADAKFFVDNRDKIIKLYDGSYGRSLTNYLKTISYDKFHVKNIFPQDDGQKIISYELPFEASSAYNGNIDYSIIEQMINNIPDIQNQIVDYDGDGFIDNLTIIIRGGEKQYSSNSTFVPHKADFGSNETWSGKRIGTYNILNTYTLLESGISAQESGVIAHEFLHSLGYPDLYRSDANDHPVYTWDIMGSANRYMSYPLAYMRMYFSGWLDIETITESQTLTLHEQSNGDGNQAYILKSPLNEYELFVVEFRKHPGYGIDENTLDRGIGGSGIIVYRVNTTVTSLSNYYGQTGVYVFRPNHADNDTEIGRVLNAYLSLESGNTTIGTTDMSKTLEDGALTFSDGTNSGIVISEVSQSSGDTMTCKVTIPESSDYDLWNDTSYNDLTGEDAFVNDKQFDIEEYGNIPYMVSYGNGKLYTQIYENGVWVQKGNVYNINNNVSQIELVSTGRDLYLCYSGWGFLYLKRWNLSAMRWEDAAPVYTDTNGFFDIDFEGNRLYIAVSEIGNQGVNGASLLCFEQNTIIKCGQYLSNTTCGSPCVCVVNGRIYVSVRQGLGNVIRLYEYENGSYREINNNMSSNTYDMASLDGKLYFSLGVTDGQNLSLHCFDGTNWSVVNSDISLGFPKLISTQGDLYIATCAVDGSGKARVFVYDKDKNIIVQEGEDVDNSAKSVTMTANNNHLYVAIQRQTDGSLAVKKKDTSNSLLSLTIIPPRKLTYTLGDDFNADGLRVIANYTKGSREIFADSYRISGFNTDKPGSYLATVSYGGKNNTFAYEVLKAAQEPEPETPLEGTVEAKGIYVFEMSEKKIVAGMVTESSHPQNVEYSWYACKDGKNWILVQDWVCNNEWLTWTPDEFGEYVLVCKAKIKGNEKTLVQATTNVSYNPVIKGICQMPYTGDGGGYLIGVESYDNPNQSYRYELLILDCTLLAQGKDAWIYTTTPCMVSEGNAFWTIWQPKYGYYWTLFRVYDKNGKMIDEKCYGFANVY